MESKRILLTGATGFIGANLARALLDKNHEVHCLIKKSSNLWRINEIKAQLNLHTASLSNAKEVKLFVKQAKPEVVYHLATYGGYPFQNDFHETLEVNVIGTLNLISALPSSVECIVNTGSSSEYGEKSKPMSETDSVEPLNFYGVTKSFATIFGRFMHKTQGKPIVTLRLFSVYGPFEEKGRLVPFVISSCLKGENPKLSSGTGVRDFVFIGDVVDAYLRTSESPEAFGEVINIGSGKQHSVKEVAEKIIALSKAKVKSEWGEIAERPVELKKWVADNSKARELLGWKPKTSLEDGLAKTFEWFEKGGMKFYG